LSKTMEDLNEKIEEEYEKYRKSVTKPNILVVGATGVGKSSLINTIFGEEVAKVGTGNPVTKELQVYKSDHMPVCLYDTVGYEIGTDKQKDFLSNVVQYAVDSNGKKLEERIHLVWYCIAATSHRVHAIDLNVIKKLNNEGIPVAVLLTKSDNVTDEESQKMKEIIEEELYNDIFETTNVKLDEFGYLDTFKLINWSIEQLPEGLKRAFISAQKLDLEKKRNEANKIIIQHTTSSGIIGMSPIPFSDAPLLLSNQAGMFARILFVYDLNAFHPMITNLMGGIGISTLISTSGVWLVGQLLKLIPGVGTVGGAIISGSVASGITAAIGYGISEICYRLNKYILENDKAGLEDFLNNMQEFFKDFVMNAFKNRSSKVG